MTDLKTIDYRGGLIRFRVPASWKEEYEKDGGGTFYADEPESGTLRLNVLTFEGPALPGRKELLSAMRGRGNAEWLDASYAFTAYQSQAAESGTPITIFYWQIAGAVPPKHLRLAVFSYTVLASEAGSARVKEEIALLEREIRAATFAPALGV